MQAGIAALVILPSRRTCPDKCSRGTGPIHAYRAVPKRDRSPAPAAREAVAVSRTTPGMVRCRCGEVAVGLPGQSLLDRGHGVPRRGMAAVVLLPHP